MGWAWCARGAARLPWVGRCVGGARGAQSGGNGVGSGRQEGGAGMVYGEGLGGLAGATSWKGVYCESVKQNAGVFAELTKGLLS